MILTWEAGVDAFILDDQTGERKRQGRADRVAVAVFSAEGGRHPGDAPQLVGGANIAGTLTEFDEYSCSGGLQSPRTQTEFS